MIEKISLKLELVINRPGGVMNHVKNACPFSMINKQFT